MGVLPAFSTAELGRTAGRQNWAGQRDGRTGPDSGTDGCKIKTSDSLAAVLGLGFRVWILLDFVLSCAFEESGESTGTQKKRKEKEDARASRGRGGQEVSREALH